HLALDASLHVPIATLTASRHHIPLIRQAWMSMRSRLSTKDAAAKSYPPALVSAGLSVFDPDAMLRLAKLNGLSSTTRKRRRERRSPLRCRELDRPQRTAAADPAQILPRRKQCQPTPPTAANRRSTAQAIEGCR